MYPFLVHVISFFFETLDMPLVINNETWYLTTKNHRSKP
jgi:hypothetical protein